MSSGNLVYSGVSVCEMEMEPQDICDYYVLWTAGMPSSFVLACGEEGKVLNEWL